MEMWPGDQVWKCLQNQNLNVFSIHLILSASSVCANRVHRSSGEKSGLCKCLLCFASWLHICKLWLLWEYVHGMHRAADKGNNLIWIKMWKKIFKSATIQRKWYNRIDTLWLYRMHYSLLLYHRTTYSQKDKEPINPKNGRAKRSRTKIQQQIFKDPCLYQINCISY